MTGCQNDNITIWQIKGWQNEKKRRQQDDKVTRWQNHKMTSWEDSKMKRWQNDKLQGDKMTRR